MKIETLEDALVAARATGFDWEEIAAAFGLDCELPPLEIPPGVKIATGPTSEAESLEILRVLEEDGQGIARAAARRRGEMTQEALAELFEARGSKQDLVAIGINVPSRVRQLGDATLKSLRLRLLSRRGSVPALSPAYDAACIKLDACVREIVNRIPEPPQP